MSVLVTDFGSLGSNAETNTATIQAAINFAIQSGIYYVDMPEGNYPTSDTLHLGFGISYNGQSFVSICLRAPAFGEVASCNLLPTFTDRPVINIQGTRNSGTEGIAIRGPVTPPLATNPTALASPSNFIPAGAKDDPNAPFCGVCIDGYGGSVPAHPYPTPTYPAFLGTITGAYGRSTSSAPFVRRCQIVETLIGVMCQPNCDSNGDFLDCSGTEFSGNKVSVAWGNVNARSNNLSKTRHALTYTCFDAVSYGPNNPGNHGGNCAGTYDDASADQCFQLFNITRDWCTSFAVTNFYGEGLLQIGSTPGNNAALKFIGCRFGFDSNYTPTNAYVAPVCDGNNVEFDGCTLDGYFSNFPFNGRPRFKDCVARPGGFMFGGVSATEQRASNAFVGLLADPTYVPLGPIVSNSKICISNGTPVYYDAQDTNQIASYWSHGVNQFEHLTHSIRSLDRAGGLGSLSNVFTGIATSGCGFTGTTTNSIYELGDMFYASAGLWFYCSTRQVNGDGTFTLTLTYLYNFSIAAGVYTLLLDPMSAAMQNSQISYFPVDVFIQQRNDRFFVLTAGSPVVIVVDRGGQPANVPSDIAPASKLLWCGMGSLPLLRSTQPFPANTAINSIGTQSIQMASQANVSGTYLAGPGIAKVI